MGIIEFSRKKKFKLLVFAVGGLGIVFLMIGIILTSVSGAEIRPSSMEIIASDAEVSGNEYSFDVYKQYTSFQVKTEPANTTLPVNFIIKKGGECISNIKSIKSGAYATIALKDTGYRGLFHYSRADDPHDQIIIYATCGTKLAIINVRILLPDDAGTVTAVLRRQQGSMIKEEKELSLSTLENSTYHVNVTFKIKENVASKIREKEIYNTGYINTKSHYKEFTFVDIDGPPTGIKLFGNSYDSYDPNNPSSQYTSYEIPSLPEIYTTYAFKISIEFFGVEFFCNFFLTVVE